MKPQLLALLPFCIPATMAGDRTSANYSIATDTTDAGGLHSASTNYSQDGSSSGIAGVSNGAAPVTLAKHGYIAQLYKIEGLTPAAPSTTVNEGDAIQLGAREILDDATSLTVAGANVAWSVQSGPLTGTDAGGLATAGLVYQDTAAIVQGTRGAFTGTLGLTVIDSIPDNFGSYAADGIGDAWQFQYFGLDSLDAAPGLDPDGDGQDNRFEFIAGLIPTDPLSRFLLRIEPDPVVVNSMDLIFSPIIAGRTYSVETASSPALGSWTPLIGAGQSDLGDVRTVTDSSPSTPQQFYRVNITRP